MLRHGRILLFHCEGEREGGREGGREGAKIGMGGG